MDRKKLLPSFFVIGTQKSGTTTLHDWLSSEPGIRLPSQKETHFFSMEEIFNRGLDWYMDQFPKTEPDSAAFFGEVDPDYIFYENTPDRIKAFIDKPRLILILRNPIERAYSHYLMSYRRGIETLPFSEALRSEESRRSHGDKHYNPHFSYMGRGEFCAQIGRYREVFPESEFLFIKYDELFNAETGKDIYQAVCRFIGLKEPKQTFDVAKKTNVASRFKSKLFADFIYGKSPLKKTIGLLIPSKSLKFKIAVLMDKLNRVNITDKSDEWWSQVPVEMLDDVTRGIQKLETITGLKLQDWIEKNLTMIKAKTT